MQAINPEQQRKVLAKKKAVAAKESKYKTC